MIRRLLKLFALKKIFDAIFGRGRRRTQRY
jgi:hypothetical protein